MTSESDTFEKKSLRALENPDWKDLARHFVAFANHKGGTMWIGVEDDEDAPPPNQRVAPDVLDEVRRRIPDLTVNVGFSAEIVTAPNGGEYMEAQISRANRVASTSSGRFFRRIGSQSKSVGGEEVEWLFDQRSVHRWEARTSTKEPREAADPSMVSKLVDALRTSHQAKPSVKEKSPDQLLDHYNLANGPHLTNLGVLVVGTPMARAKLSAAPIIQVIERDESGEKINKMVWDDHTASPMELIDLVWEEVPTFRQFYELPDGMRRKHVPAFDKTVVRELLVNALVHRPYTQPGDITLDLYPDRLVVRNPGSFPVGVSAENVLLASARRNEDFARLFHDLGLMEREGSGLDNIYERLLSHGRPPPELAERHENVEVTVRRRIANPQIVKLMAVVGRRHQLETMPRIVLGLLAQSDFMSAADIAKRLGLENAQDLSHYLQPLVRLGIVMKNGQTQATRYFVDPQLMLWPDAPGTETSGPIGTRALDALILEDIGRHPGSLSAEIRRRIGPEISRVRVWRRLRKLAGDGKVLVEGSPTNARYSLAP